MTDSTVTAKPGIKPEHLTMEEWVESRIARFEDGNMTGTR